jgi:hypothetical protein
MVRVSVVVVVVVGRRYDSPYVTVVVDRYVVW